MANVLFAWELGGGLSHIAEMLPLIQGLRAHGHPVYAAIRDVPRAATLFAEAGAGCLPAPAIPQSTPRPKGQPGSFSHVLEEAGFADPIGLQKLTEGWSKLFDSVAPELIVFNHSPAALLAAWGRPIKRVVLGNGFCCPADCTPLPDLRSRKAVDSEALRAVEWTLLDSANRVLKVRGMPRLTQLAQLYAAVDDVFLTTLAEFDPYQGRSPRRYRGPWTMTTGLPPTWPAGSGKRVLAYLAPTPDLPPLLNLLCTTGHRLIIAGNHDLRIRRHFERANVRFEDRLMDLPKVAAECDAAVLNGNHTTTLIMLLAGKPVLQVPLFVEQGLNARATVELGAGLSTFPSGIRQVREQLAELLEIPTFSGAAREFSAKYSDFSQGAETAEAIRRLLELLGDTAACEPAAWD